MMVRVTSFGTRVVYQIVVMVESNQSMWNCQRDNIYQKQLVVVDVDVVCAMGKHVKRFVFSWISKFLYIRWRYKEREREREKRHFSLKLLNVVYFC